MNAENVTRHVRALWRADRIIADIRLRHLLVSLGMKAFAALIAAFGLLMLELAAYFALVQVWSAILSAAALGAINFAIAATIFVIASRGPPAREIALANDIHDSAINALQVEAQGLQAQVSGFLRHPLEGALLPLLLPLLTVIVRQLTKPKASKPEAG
ncbi:phage holin family protein [Bradyrhizobium sp. U87765 SZCCT0131]|uniref:phage holin family protein n=1 Tax=unclassified Bradyrhizobium TaxID=2631580 RepID=UPI001BA440FE|nr:MULTISPECIES: phage holin family protein [unclassified Bradyrhizobium]MBR1217780.1 phage holin family protein [Bradyrhizobium sp. U87765 SZCCT0131]MBR1261274.1 phage holin family protein [Bradyrhizobium sp. U87765 SZCCT0134]MBR1303278.1 phage holin family protein [Bradyrhizobium sp. U87765 SZCCT0110]MBR1318884.1 phage holin family protein [Bradyrhizobium sp. U87765 SZCCT0109]MBR1347209.1 phage holin family protein [Bradyrhizobium sp. U87765 SZCCT0048]